MQAQAAGLGHFLSFFIVMVLPKEYTFRDVALALPDVSRVSFLYIDYEKLDLILYLRYISSMRPTWAWKGGSSVTAEDQCHWAFTPKAG